MNTRPDKTISNGSFSLALNTTIAPVKISLHNPSEKHTLVRSIRDIESAHIKGNTTVTWNSQTSTILDGILNNRVTAKEMGTGSMTLTHNDLFCAEPASWLLIMDRIPG